MAFTTAIELPMAIQILRPLYMVGWSCTLGRSFQSGNLCCSILAINFDSFFSSDFFLFALSEAPISYCLHFSNS